MLSTILSGKYQEALNDAQAAIKLEPTLIKAIEIGTFCVCLFVCLFVCLCFFGDLKIISITKQPQSESSSTLR